MSAENMTDNKKLYLHIPCERCGLMHHRVVNSDKVKFVRLSCGCGGRTCDHCGRGLYLVEFCIHLNFRPIKCSCGWSREAKRLTCPYVKIFDHFYKRRV
jgi:hypothetical protein